MEQCPGINLEKRINKIQTLIEKLQHNLIGYDNWIEVTKELSEASQHVKLARIYVQDDSLVLAEYGIGCN